LCLFLALGMALLALRALPTPSNLVVVVGNRDRWQ
jgi:hypothetical protein